MLFTILLALFTSVRAYGLLEYPIYLDEGVYIWWAYLFNIDSNFAYNSMQDGKTPLFIWLTAALHEYVKPYILSGRLISVFSGAISAIAWLSIFKLAFKKSSIFWPFVIFIVAPYALFVERMAFVDSLLVACGSLSILFFYASSRFVDSRRYRLSLLAASVAGVFLGLSYLTKTSAVAFLYATFAVGTLWVIRKLCLRKYLESAFLVVNTIILYLVYNEFLVALRVAAHRFDNVGVKEAGLTYTLPEILSSLTTAAGSKIYLSSLNVVSQYFVVYLSSFLLLFLLGGVLIVRYHRKSAWILLYMLVIFVGTFLSAKVTATRYFYPVVPSIIIIAGFGAGWLWERRDKALRVMLIAAFFLPVYQAARVVVDPVNATHASHEQNFVSSDLTAIGLSEVIQILHDTADQSVVGVVGVWGIGDGAALTLNEAGMEAYPVNLFVFEGPGREGSCTFEKKKIGDVCYQLTIDRIIDSTKPNKYLYIVPRNVDLSVLRQLIDFELVREFERPMSDARVYLLRLHGTP